MEREREGERERALTCRGDTEKEEEGEAKHGHGLLLRPVGVGSSALKGLREGGCFLSPSGVRQITAEMGSVDI